MSKTFSDYGKEFQEKFVQALITDPRFSEQMLEVFRPEFVEVKHLQFLADRYFLYAKKYRVSFTETFDHNHSRRFKK